MIVRDESRVIRRALDSVVDLIDYWVICDTGSQDGTPGIIEEYFRHRGIGGELHRREWRNFGHNRTEALRMAEGKAGYLLLIDADMVLHRDPRFDPGKLSADAYQIAQEQGDLRYYNVRLVKSGLGWRCVGLTHEYYTADADLTTRRLPYLWIEDIGDGGSKDNKLDRDIVLLKQGIREEPDNPRYHFYLAQSYRDAGETDQAIALYDQRIGMGGWDEEVWYARFMKGACLARRRDYAAAIFSLHQAFEARPARAEPLWTDRKSVV